jgi:tetratricopeptide (TPR) repeat protein
MTQTSPQSSPAPGKGVRFFDQADKVAEMGNAEYAIQMYIEGIRREPDNLERGHKPLREVALKRKAKGGKGIGMMEQFKLRPGKDPTENFLNGVYCLSKDPGSITYMEQVLTGALKLELPGVIKWICDILLESERQAKKPSRRLLHLITDSYEKVEEYVLATQACDMALKLSPDDGALLDKMRNLSAKYTIQKGKYDQDGDFTKGIKDFDRQKELIQRDSLAQSGEFLDQQVAKAREAYVAAPTVVGKISAFVDALLKTEEDSYENEAIDVLAKAHKDLGAYQFKARIGDIRIRQMTRRYHKLISQGDKQAAADHRLKQLEFELQEYTERAVNYPTDLGVKFELGRRQYLAGKLDDSISSLQQAQRDPRRHTQAMTILGQAFAKKGWYREASETYQRALEGDISEDRTKELRYSLGDVLEKMGKLPEAQEQFSMVAQLDFNFRDVRERLDTVRKKISTAHDQTP